MKKAYFIIILIFALFLNACTTKNQSLKDNDSATKENPYLGQKSPGLTPEPFVPGIVTTEHYELTGVFMPDMKEFYLIRDGGKYEKPSLVVFKNKIINGTSQLYLREWEHPLSLQMARPCIWAGAIWSASRLAGQM